MNTQLQFSAREAPPVWLGRRKPRPSLGRRDKRILLVDDDPDQLEYFKVLLESHRYRVSTAQGGREAIRKLCSVRFDLLVCDAMMPDINGLDLVYYLRKSTSLEHVNVIVLSCGGPELEIPALNLGANCFCRKAAARSELPAQVERILR